MSETFDGNTGWQVDDAGDVVPPDDPQGLLPRKAAEHINRRNLDHDSVTNLSQPPSGIPDVIDPVAGLTQEEARALNEHAQNQRGGSSLTPDPTRVEEKPGEGRSNWKV